MANVEAVMVGLDMSLTSTAAVACYQGRTHILCYQQRQREKGALTNVPVAPGVSLSRHPQPLGAGRWTRLDHVVTDLIQWIEGLAPVSVPRRVHIEGYAYGIGGSSAVSTLCELGGVLRWHLHTRGWAWEQLSPSSVKKHWTGDGRAGKPDMAARMPHLAALVTLLGCEARQHPLEDVVDAWAIHDAGRVGIAPKPPRKPKKRKREPCEH